MILRSRGSASEDVEAPHERGVDAADRDPHRGRHAKGTAPDAALARNTRHPGAVVDVRRRPCGHLELNKQKQLHYVGRITRVVHAACVTETRRLLSSPIDTSIGST